jgi:hypothetical protein
VFTCLSLLRVTDLLLWPWFERLDVFWSSIDDLSSIEGFPRVLCWLLEKRLALPGLLSPFLMLLNVRRCTVVRVLMSGRSGVSVVVVVVWFEI